VFQIRQYAFVIVSAEEASELLRKFDDPVASERPPGFDKVAVSKRFEELLGRLNRAFNCLLSSESGTRVQDASYYGKAVIPAESTETGADITVVISNFGNLSVYAIERPGAYSDAEREVLISQSDRDRVEAALAEAGYVVLPEDVLWERYDGANEALKRYWSDRQSSWFDRFFSYL
jgi:hypothetical protein